MDDTTTVVKVLAGDLPEDEHAAAMTRFWEDHPALAGMRDVVEGVVAERRAAAAAHKAEIAAISARKRAERDGLWATAKLCDGDVDAVIAATKARCVQIMDAEVADISRAIGEHYGGVERCMRYLFWEAEREAMAGGARCAK